METAFPLETIRQLDGWQTHSWYDNSNGTSYSHDHAELEVRGLRDQAHLLEVCRQWAGSCIERYLNEFSQAGVTRLSNPRLNRYPPGAMMREHVDHIHTLFDGEEKGVPVLTILAVLNDDYTGGEFLLCGQQVSLAAGDAIVFPSSFMFPHAVEPVKTGTRYSFVSWAW
jgi:predicted 2-oxoglutarate/Fe(II)-dependent dioxygenase YbiX